MTNFRKPASLAAIAILALVPAFAGAQEKDAKPINVSAQASPLAIATSASRTIEKEEMVKVTTVCLTGAEAWFQRQLELSEGERPQDESIRRCYRIVQVAEGNTAK